MMHAISALRTKAHFRLLLGSALACMTILPIAAPGRAAEFEVKSRDMDYGEYKGVRITYITLSGAIRSGDYARFVSIIRENKESAAFSLTLLSAGGDVEEAMKIGRLVRKLYINPWVAIRGLSHGRVIHPNFTEGGCSVPRQCICASACVFIWLGGVRRSGNFIAIHRPTFSPERFANMSAPEAKREYDRALEGVRQYLSEMSVTPRFLEAMMAVHSNEVVVVSDKALLDELERPEASFDEWLAARCGRVSKRELDAMLTIQSKLDCEKSSACARALSWRTTPEERTFAAEVEKRQKEVAACVGKHAFEAHRKALAEFQR